MTVFQRVRLLPLLVIVSFLSLTVRFSEFVTGIAGSGSALAQHEVQAEAPPLPPTTETGTAASVPATEPASAPSSESSSTSVSQSAPATGTGEGSSGEKADSPVPAPVPLPATDESKGEKVIWRDAGDAALEYSEVKEELYKDLASRREELEKRERDLATREALMKAGERELDQKLRELTAIKNEIEGLLKKQTDEEKTRIGSLVKIYEGMKAKDAARIFNTLDMDVLIQVMSQMSERKSAPILAEMSPERARTVTILLAQQQQLPGQLPQ